MPSLWTILKHLWKHRLWMDFSVPVEERVCGLCGTYLLTGTHEPPRNS